jgi:MarR family transcriptional regulator for hemolysin
MSSGAPAISTTFGRQLARAARQWRRAVDRELQPFGLTEATWLPLIRLARAPEAMRQKELAAALSVDGSAVVRILDSLQAAGLIERREETGDRRARAVTLTPAGRELVARVEASAQAVRDRALSGLSAADVETTARVLDHVARALTADACSGECADG